MFLKYYKRDFRIPSRVSKIDYDAFGGCRLMSLTFDDPKGWATYGDSQYKYERRDVAEGDLRVSEKAARLLSMGSPVGYSSSYWN